MIAHPGGWEILLDYAIKGEDAAPEFEDIKHSNDARKEAMKHLIGKTHQSVSAFPMQTTGKLEATTAKPVTPQVPDDGEKYMVIGAIAAVVIAGGLYLYKKRSA